MVNETSSFLSRGSAHRPSIPVNLASRVEHLTRGHATDILITAAVRETLDARFALLELPAAAVAGISKPVVTYAVEGVLPS